MIHTYVVHVLLEGNRLTVKKKKKKVLIYNE